jgi:hypothetical protein
MTIMNTPEKPHHPVLLQEKALLETLRNHGVVTSRKTLRRYREIGLIAHKYIGRRVYYYGSAIDFFLK